MESDSGEGVQRLLGAKGVGSPAGPQGKLSPFHLLRKQRKKGARLSLAAVFTPSPMLCLPGTFLGEARTRRVRRPDELTRSSTFNVVSQDLVWFRQLCPTIPVDYLRKEFLGREAHSVFTS